MRTVFSRQSYSMRVKIPLCYVAIYYTLAVHIIIISNGWDWPQTSYTISIVIDCLEKSIEDFEKRFEDLALAALKEVKNENKVSVEDLKFGITLLPSKIKPDHASFLKDNMDILSTATNLQEIFMHLNLYWDYFNYTLLQVIIDKYGSNDLKERMQSYATDIEQFWKETTVAEFIPHPPKRINSNEFIELRSVIDKPTSEYTLFEVEELRRTFCQKYNLPRFALIFSGLGKGSVVLIWSISIEFEKHLCEEEGNRDIKLGELVTSMSLRGKCVRANYKYKIQRSWPILYYVARESRVQDKILCLELNLGYTL